MKRMSILMGAACMAATTMAATVEQVIARQQWPWSSDVKVEYKITGVTTPVNIKVRVFNDATELTLPAAAIKGDISGITEDVAGEFLIDPVVAFGSSQNTIAKFKVKLELEDAVLYKIYNLRDQKTITSLTAADLKTGAYGTYEENYGNIIAGSSLENVMIWTGVTNDVKYKTTHLVMRHVFAKNKSFTMGTAGDTDWEVPHKVSFTNDYYVSVFPLTDFQYSCIHDKATTKETTATTMGPKMDAYQAIRGYFANTDDTLGWWPVYGVWRVEGTSVFYPDTTKSAYDCVQSGKIAARLRDYFGDRFDLITEAEWEYACRAGTTTPNYAGGNDEATISQIAWYVGNSSNDTACVSHEVGLKAPNPWGFYDLQGNVWEYCLDAYQRTLSTDDVIDPPGPASKNRYEYRIVRGGSASSAASSIHSAIRRCECPHVTKQMITDGLVGFRLGFDVLD